MLRFMSLYTCATFSAYVALNTTPIHGLSAVITAMMCGFGTGGIWHLTGLALRWMYRNDRDAALMHGGYCPACETLLSLEVTSEHHNESQGTRITAVRCTACKECFTVTSSGGGPLVKRHGKGYTHSHD